MLKKLIFCVLLCCSFICEAKAPPPLTPKETRQKIEEILKHHVSYQVFSKELIKRSMLNFLEELDPGKTYLLEEEVARWINPSDELLEAALQQYKKEEFATFEEMYEAMLGAIERRRILETKCSSLDPIEGVESSEFKEMSWAKNAEELCERIHKIRSLQLETAQKVEEGDADQFLQRIAKRRLNREDELISLSPAEKKRQVLTYVLKAMSSALDSQTAYFTPIEASQFLIQVQQRLFGIGAQLRDDLNGFTIVRLLEGGPARMSNQLKEGDRIIAVNHELVAGMDITEAVELIRGQEGTSVLLTILRETGEGLGKKQEKLNIEIVRSEVVLKESRLESSYEPYGEGMIGIFHLYSFYQDQSSSSATDLYAAIDALKKQHSLKGVILDLRGNGGGLLQQAVAVTGLFIKKGIVVSVKDNSKEVQHLRNVDGTLAWEGPLIVLTNKLSASAAEIVAQTLQDYGRAILIGDEETYGKGTFQTFTLEAAKYAKVNPKGEYKVTRGRYYTVSGKSPQLVGVKTDIVVPGVFSQMELGERFSKFPVETDQIPSNFEDPLHDVPFFYRHQLARLYKTEKQVPLVHYQKYFATLRKNSEERLKNNQNYQNFLKELEKDFHSEPSAYFGQNDLQLEETVNVMKDLIILEEKDAIKEDRAA